MHTAHPHEYILTLRTQHAGGSSKDPISLSRCSVCVAVCVSKSSKDSISLLRCSVCVAVCIAVCCSVCV